MKTSYSIIIVFIFAGSLFFVACGDREDSKQPESKLTAQDVKDKSKEAFDTAAAYTQQKKEAYLKQIEAELTTFDQKLDKLKVAATEITDEAKDEYNQQIALLDQKKESTLEKLNALKSASGESWIEVKSGVDKAFDELRTAYDSVIARFNLS